MTNAPLTPIDLPKKKYQQWDRTYVNEMSRYTTITPPSSYTRKPNRQPHRWLRLRLWGVR